MALWSPQTVSPSFMPVFFPSLSYLQDLLAFPPTTTTFATSTVNIFLEKKNIYKE